MNILHINSNYLCTALHQNMIETMNELNVNSKVFVPIYHGAISVINPNGNVIVSECFKKIDRLLFDNKQQKIFKAVTSTCFPNHYDVIHAYTLFTDGNCAMKLAGKYNIPYVVAVRNTDVNVFFKKRVLLRRRGIEILLGAEKVVFLSETYKNQLLLKYIPQKLQKKILEKSVIIPNGIDDFWLDHKYTIVRKLHGKNLNLIYAGAIDTNKNIIATQMAMRILQDTMGICVRLTVVGKVHDEILYKKLKKDQNTVFIPAVNKEKLIELYRQNDIFVMPSKTETFGLVYAEALSQGLPIIYTKDQGFDGQFSEGWVGFSVDPSSPKSIAEKIRNIMENYTEMSCRCPDACEKFSWNSICSIYEQIYNEIMK